MKSTLFRAIPAALACAAMSLLGLVSAPSATAQPAELASTDCTNVTVLGVRGSDAEENQVAGKWQSKEPPADKFGFANTKAVASFEKLLPGGTTVKRVVVPYTPATVDYYVHNAGEVTAHKNGVEGAKALIVSTVSETLKNCPQTKLVIVGYGQGAEAAHQAASMISAHQQDSLGAVWLIADPILNAKDPNEFRYYGGDNKATGRSGAMIDILSQAVEDSTRPFRAQLAPKDTTFPASLTGKVVSVCSHGDATCESNTGAMMFDPRAAYSTPSLIDVPARFVATALTKLCNDVTFFAARGSGEKFNNGSDGQPVQKEATAANYMTGFGTTLATLAFAIEEKYDKSQGKTFGHVGVDYQALSASTNDTPNALWPLPSGYPASVKTGINSEAGPKQFRDLITRCPKTIVMMLGYSQGGQVIHEMLMHLTPAERSHIGATVLVADAIRKPNDNSTLTFMGTPVKFEVDGSKIFNGIGAMRLAAGLDTSCLAFKFVTESPDIINQFFRLANAIVEPGLCHILPSDIRFSDVMTQGDYPSDTSQNILNVCALKDAVCDIQASFVENDKTVGMNEGPGNVINNLLNVGAIHGEYYKQPSFYQFPASWAYSELILKQASKP